MWSKEDYERFDQIVILMNAGKSDKLSSDDWDFFKNYVSAEYPKILAKRQRGNFFAGIHESIYRDEAVLRYYGRKQIWDLTKSTNLIPRPSFSAIIHGSHLSYIEYQKRIERSAQRPINSRVTLLEWAIDQSNASMLMKVFCDDFGADMKLSEEDNNSILKKGAVYAAKNNKRDLMMPYLKHQLDEFHKIKADNPSLSIIDDFFHRISNILGCKPAIMNLTKRAFFELFSIFLCKQYDKTFQPEDFVAIEISMLNVISQTMASEEISLNPEIERKAIADFYKDCLEYLNGKFPSAATEQYLPEEHLKAIVSSRLKLEQLFEQVNNFNKTPPLSSLTTSPIAFNRSFGEREASLTPTASMRFGNRDASLTPTASRSFGQRDTFFTSSILTDNFCEVEYEFNLG